MTPAGGYPVGGQTSIDIRNEHMQYILTWCVRRNARAFLLFGSLKRKETHSLRHHRYSLCALTSVYCYKLIWRRWR